MTNLTITATDVAPILTIEQFTGPSAEAINAGQYARLNTTTGKIELGNASSVAEARDGGIAITTAEVAGQPVTVVRQGIVDLGAALDSLAYDADVYLSDTDGTLADAAGTVAKRVGTVVPAWGQTTADKALRVGMAESPEIPANSLSGTEVANVGNNNVIGGIPVVHKVVVPGGAAGDVDVTLTHKTEVIEVWAVHTGGAGEASDTLTVKNGANAISSAMDWSGADAAVVRTSGINDANQTIAAGGTLRVSTTDNDAGNDVGAGIVYVLGLRVA